MNSKWCYVPGCGNTTANSIKTFILVPKEKKTREQWFQVAHRDTGIMPSSTRLFCCEDHFNLPEDLLNYLQWKMMGGKKFLKPGVLPSRFDCQTQSLATRATFASQDRKENRKVELDVIGGVIEKASRPTHQVSLEDQNGIRMNMDTFTDIETPGTIIDGLIESAQQPPHQTSLENQNDTMMNIVSHSVKDIEPGTIFCMPTCSEVSIQANMIPHYRSAYSQVVITHRTISTSPLKSEIPVVEVDQEYEDLSSSSYDGGSDDDDPDYQLPYRGQYDDSDCSLESEKAATLNLSNSCRCNTRQIIEISPKLYIGLPLNCFFVTKLLANFLDYSGQKLNSLDVVYLVLRKIRLDEPFPILAHQFGISRSLASTIFCKYVNVIAHHLKEYIIWPESEKIEAFLPLAFRTRYRHVESIIDCLEIEIEKPENALHQALTWSDYKKANTVKYLISCTPDGLINYISQGFGGRITDTEIVKESGYLKLVRKGMSVLADRGFTNLETILHEHSCKLVRPPSVLANEILPHNLVRQGKAIASVRIHVEKLIRRLREFRLLRFNACTDTNLVSKLDYAVVISCGLINLQAPLIKI